MDEDALAGEFESHRARLTAIATRTLGSRADAEDAVQETWLRLQRNADSGVENLGGWLTRVLGRICIDLLRARSARAEISLDDRHEPLVVMEDAPGPEHSAVEADSLGIALLLVLNTLQPEERMAFVLHDVFGVPFREIGPIVGRSADAAKMLASRARRKVREGPQPSVEQRRQREVVDAFLAAARDGDFAALLHVLDPDVTWHRRTAHGDILSIGADKVIAAVRLGNPERVQARRVSVNGAPGILAWGPSGRPLALMACTVADGKIVRIDSVLDPKRLGRMDLPGPVRPAR